VLVHRHGTKEPSRVMVVGAGGFLGRGLVEALQGTRTSVVPLGSRDIDLSAPDAGAKLGGLLREGDTLVFLAALTPDKGRGSDVLIKNVAMGRAVAAAAKAAKVGHLVYASSDAVYSFATGLISEETPAIPNDLYGVMHRARELILAEEAVAPLAVLRFTAVYGAGDTHNSYGPNRFVRQVLKEGRIALFGEGEETRDHLYIKDGVAVLRRVIAQGSTGLLNVASGVSMSFSDVARAVADRMPQVRIEPSPRRNPIIHRHFVNTDMLSAFPGIRFTPFAEGLNAMLSGMENG